MLFAKNERRSTSECFWNPLKCNRPLFLFFRMKRENSSDVTVHLNQRRHLPWQLRQSESVLVLPASRNKKKKTRRTISKKKRSLSASGSLIIQVASYCVFHVSCSKTFSSEIHYSFISLRTQVGAMACFEIGFRFAIKPLQTLINSSKGANCKFS